MNSTDTIARALALCHSGRLNYVNATTIAVRREHTLEEDPSEETIDFSERYLAPSRLYALGGALSDDADLTIATILAIDSQLAGAGANKATHKIVVFNVRVLSKLWEWGRLYGLYAVADWKPGHMRLLERQLSKGRWGEALQLKARTKKLLATRPGIDLIVRDADSDAPLLRGGLARLVESNVAGHELGCVRKMVFRYAGITDARAQAQEADPEESGVSSESLGRPTVSWFLQTMRIINELARIDSPYGFSFTPFINPRATAAKYAKPSKRTPTMPIDHAVGLLVNSFSWTYEKADAVIAAVDTLAEIAPRLKAESEKDRGRVLNNYWAQSSARALVEQKLGKPVRLFGRQDSDEEKCFLPILTSKLMTGCFIIIAGMNARRKDEIIHRSFGIRRDSVRPINDALGVYEATFFIEKTLKSYAPYYVNQATYDAHAVLVRLEAAHLRLEKAMSVGRTESERKHSLFWSCRMTVNQGALASRTWWDFNLKRGIAAKEFLVEACGSEADVAVSAHMFRRFYAIIFYYRFDHGGLLHLRYQLAHLDVEMTLQYVTDAFLVQMIERIPAALKREPDAVRAALQSEWATFQRELETVESEKTSEMLTDLLKGGRSNGGFPKLIERLHRMLSRDVDYSMLDDEAQATYLRERIAKRGHALTPMLNTNCMVGESHGRAAKCANPGSKGPAQENASAETCAKCAYSWGNDTHVAGQRLDLVQLEDEAAKVDSSTIQAQALIRKIKNLKRVIVLHEERLLKTTTL